MRSLSFAFDNGAAGAGDFIHPGKEGAATKYPAASRDRRRGGEYPGQGMKNAAFRGVLDR